MMLRREALLLDQRVGARRKRVKRSSCVAVVTRTSLRWRAYLYQGVCIH
jgi:hypothetical protein